MKVNGHDHTVRLSTVHVAPWLLQIGKICCALKSLALDENQPVLSHVESIRRMADVVVKAHKSIGNSDFFQPFMDHAVQVSIDFLGRVGETKKLYYQTIAEDLAKQIESSNMQHLTSLIVSDEFRANSE